MFEMTTNDRDILRRLAADKSEIADDPVNVERKTLWTALNDREPVRPLVHIMQVPWHEMNVNDELTCTCESVCQKPRAGAEAANLPMEALPWGHDYGTLHGVSVGGAEQWVWYQCR